MTRFVLLLMTLSLASLGRAWAETELGRNRGAEDYLGGDEESREPIYRDFLKFDRLYTQRQRTHNVTARQWVTLAKEFDKYNRLLDSPGHVPNKAYFLRGMLIRGECYLLASIEYYKQNPKGLEFHETYDAGIRQLRRVLARADDKIDYLPRFSLMSTEQDRGDYFDLDPRAGYETIGTGIKVDLFLPDSDLTPNRDVTYRIERFADVDLLRKFIERYLGELGPTGRRNKARRAYGLEEPDSLLVQIRTSEKARQLLSEFCPWGVDLFLFLRDDAMLTGTLNFAILRPYAIKGQEFLSEGSLRGDPPVSVDTDLCAIIGSGVNVAGRRNGARDIHWVKDSFGLVEYPGGRLEEIAWSMVQERPSYTIWYLSPACYDLKLSEKISYGLKGVKLFTAGPMDLIADEFIGYLMNLYGELAGKDGFVYGLTNMAVEGNNWGVVQDEFFLKGEIAERKVVSQILVNGFKKLEEQEREWLFEDIDPKMSRMGKGYLGETIPPVIIRSEVFGYEKAKPHKYTRSRRFLRYHQLDPAYLAGAGAYDLRFDPVQIARRDGYKKREMKVHDGAWKVMPNLPDKPLGTRQFITDHTPKCQILDIRFAAKEFSAWKTKAARRGLRAALYSPLDAQFRRPLAKGPLEKPHMVLQLINRDIREETDEPFGVHLKPYADAVVCKSEIFTDYRLRVEAGDKVLKEMPIVFAARPGRPATARREELRAAGTTIPGYVLMKVEPKAKKKSVLDQYKGMTLRYGLRMKYKLPGDPREPDKIRYRFFKDNWIAKGTFEGNLFTGKLLSLSKRTGTVQFTINPETMELSDLTLEAQWARSGTQECHLRIQTTGVMKFQNVKYPGRPESPEISLKGEAVCPSVEFSYEEKNPKDGTQPRIVLGFDCEGYQDLLYGGRPKEAYWVIGIK